MAHQNTILSSTNSDDGSTCIDIFRRPDGSFGFDMYRRDPEDQKGWFSIGHFDILVFDTFDTACAAAKDAVPWFDGPREPIT